MLHISAYCIKRSSIFCTKFHIAIYVPLCYIIIRKGDTNVLEEKEAQMKVEEPNDKRQNFKRKFPIIYKTNLFKVG